VIAVVPLLYVSGFLAQLMDNYTAWSDAGGVPGDGTSPKLPDRSILICLLSIFSVTGLKAVLAMAGAVAVLLFLIWYRDRENSRGYDRERNFHYSEKGTYGTAGFMTQEEMKQILDVTSIRRTTGTILGTVGRDIVSIPVDTRMNKNIAVYGASGSMKSRAFVRNMIFQSVLRGESMILTDPKSELYEDMSLYLEKNGYQVKVFNLIHPEHSDRWNCLAEIQHDQLMAQICADVIIRNTSTGKIDHFWDTSELNFLKALILYVDQEKELSGRNIGQAYRMMSEMEEWELDALFDMLPKGHPAKAPYNIFKQASEKVRGGVIVGLGARLQVYQNELIRALTSENDIDLELPGTEKCAYFCITSDQDSTFDFLASLFFSFLFIKLVRFADAKGEDGKLPVGVNFILDEFPNIGAIPDFKKKISTVRSRNISLSVIFQNIAQLKNRYPNDEWQEIIGSCDTQLALGCTDEMTARFISNRTGEVTIAVNSESKQLHTMRFSDYTPDYRETSSDGRRKLMTPDEILRMPMDEALVILRGQNVLKVKKFDYTRHPERKKLKKRKAVEYNPVWREKKEKKPKKGMEPNQKRSIPQETTPENKDFMKISKKDLMGK
jgi:type IV secretion system protein VirD4